MIGLKLPNYQHWKNIGLGSNWVLKDTFYEMKCYVS